MSGANLPEKGIFQVVVPAFQYYELVYNGDTCRYDRREIGPESPVATALKILVGVPFPGYLLKKLDEGEVSAYLNILGIVDKGELKKGPEANTCGMMVRMPEDPPSFSVIATRSEDISYLKTGTKYMALGAEPLKEPGRYPVTRAFAQAIHEGYGDLLLQVFGVGNDRGLLVTDFFVPRNNKYLTTAFDPLKRERTGEFEREPGRTYPDCLGGLLLKR